MRQVLLIGHPGRPEALHVAKTLVRDLAHYGIDVTGEEDELKAFGLCGEPNVRALDKTSLKDCELAVVLGGDGTILRAAEIARPAGLPLLGINLGHVGFLAEAERDDIHTTAAKIAAHDWHVEQRETLDVEVRTDGEVVWSSWALNEISVEKAARERMLEVTVEIDCRPLSSFGCDGVVVSTPTGSTAYAFSAGGPVIWPGVDAVLLVPISAHALFARPLVLSPEVHIAVDVRAGADGHGVVWADGRRSFDLSPGSRVEVRRSNIPVRLARLSSAPFTDRLVAKFDLSVVGWRGRSRPEATDHRGSGDTGCTRA